MPATERARELALTAAQAAADKKAERIVILDVADQLVITDAFVLASAPNERQVLAIVDSIQERLRELPEKIRPVRREGERSGRWVLLDYEDLIVHVQHAEEREFYALDRLWKDCPVIPFTDRDAPNGHPGVGPGTEGDRTLSGAPQNGAAENGLVRNGATRNGTAVAGQPGALDSDAATTDSGAPTSVNGVDGVA